MFLPSEKVYSVTEINNYIKDLLEGSIRTITLEGEISNYRPNISGHLYFTLKDSTNQISAVMFITSARSLQFVPKDGMKVRCTGRISVYGPQGKYQLIISSMSVAGEGAILRMIEERKQRFAREGLFDESRKKELPEFPLTIGVVTSPTGAALRDILQIAKRRNKCISVIVFPAVVQGEEAAPSIARQIFNANHYKLCDVLIVGRGGGSIEDLLPFSEEIVVRAIADSEIPIISAVGHQIDFSLSDLAADVRAPTPSAAAEMAVPLLSETLDKLNKAKSDLYTTITTITNRLRLMIRNFDPHNLELNYRNIELPITNRFENAKTELNKSMLQRISDTRQLVKNYTQILENCSPDTILSRGYAMIREKETGKIITQASSSLLNKEIEIIPASGKITARVEHIQE